MPDFLASVIVILILVQGLALLALGSIQQSRPAGRISHNGSQNQRIRDISFKSGTTEI